MTAMTIDAAADGRVERRSYRLPLIGIAAGLLFLVLIGGGLVFWRWQLTPVETVLSLAWPEEARSDLFPQTQSTRGKNPRGLAPAPDPRLVDLHPAGLLPKIGEDGSRPLDLYARPVPPTPDGIAPTPRVAILITGAGIGQLATVEAMVKLPPDMSVALSPYGSDLDRQAADLRGEGHEIFLDLPLRDIDLPIALSGPKTLSDTVSTDENRRRLFWALGRFPGYVGVTGMFGSGIANSDTVKAVLDEIPNRGLGLLDLSISPEAVMLDSEMNPKAIDEALIRLEQKAHSNGAAIGVARPSSLAIDRLHNWNAGLAARGLRLVPVSALLQGNR
jgi:uncharacterized protein